MDKFYTFCLGISIGLSAAFFTFGRFWLGVIAGIPLGGVILLCLVVIVVACVEGIEEQNYFRDDSTGDGHRN